MPRPRLRQHHNLPLPRTRLIGRERDVAGVRRAVLDSDGHLVTLTGAGGCGKTRLAIDAATELVSIFPDGVWLVELAPLGDPTLLPHVIGAALGVRERPDRSVRQSVIDHLASRELLLVLDNCEHLVEACAELADALLQSCPGLRVLATSRELLRIPGEVTWRVPSLSVPNPQLTPTADDLTRYAAVQLFVERARAGQPGFAVTSRNAEAIAQLCNRLDGLPLAIELAAARVRLLGIEQLVERLDDTFRLMVGGSRTVPSRQQTVRATLDWSHALLESWEPVVFRRLAVFAGGWSLEAAEAVCAGEGVERDGVLDLLGRLVDKSLVQVEDPGGFTRYRLLEPIRQYALERLRASNEMALVQERHAMYFDVFADQTAKTIRRDHGLEMQRWEQDNVRAALRWCLDGAVVEVGLRLARHSMFFWEARSTSHEARAWLSQLLALPRAEHPSVELAAALGYSGKLATQHGDFAAARVLHVHGLATARAVGDAFQLFNNLCDTGTGAVYRGEYLLAQEHFDEAAATARAAVDLVGDADAKRRMQACEAQGLLLLAWLAAVQADYATARLHAEAALTLARTVGEQWLIGRALSSLGETLLGQGDLATARRLLEECLSIHQQVSERWVRAYALDHLARVALAQELYPEAQARLLEGLTLRQEAGDVAMIARSLEGMAAMTASRAQPERAVRLVGAADAMRETIGAPLHPQDRAWRDCWLEPLRTVLDNETVTRAWTSGHVLSMEQAVALALSDTDAAPAASNQPDKARATSAAPLSAREQEVASLLALGLTNRQIAERLVVTDRTVAAHVEHILDKLGFATRTQIGVWAAEHGLIASSIA